AALITAVLVSARGASPNAHEWNQKRLAQGNSPAVSVRYLTLRPSERAATGRGAKGAVRRTSARNSAAGERHSTRAQLAKLKASLDAITDRLADIHLTVDVADAVYQDVDDTRWTAVADSEFSGGSARLTDSVPSIVPVAKNGIYTPDLVDEPVTP